MGTYQLMEEKEMEYHSGDSSHFTLTFQVSTQHYLDILLWYN